MSYKNGGLRHKYIIQKVDGSRIDPNADYFVLRLDTDPHARKAFRAYAESVQADNQQFAGDILHHLEQHYFTKADLPDMVTTCWLANYQCPKCGSMVVASSRHDWCNNEECDYACRK
ncbi:MAG: hypothetical protein LLF76_02830 [Planctomycetaceae bacterium]|nr:hypothetical protein [Planctomycetaceae bacterium]